MAESSGHADRPARAGPNAAGNSFLMYKHRLGAAGAHKRTTSKEEKPMKGRTL